MKEQEEYCTCGEQCNCPCKRKHECEYGSDDKCDFGRKMLELADHAWMEVLKEKIKANILAHKGEEVQKLADIISKANGQRWENKMKLKKELEEYKDSLHNLYKNK